MVKPMTKPDRFHGALAILALLLAFAVLFLWSLKTPRTKYVPVYLPVIPGYSGTMLDLEVEAERER